MTSKAAVQLEADLTIAQVASWHQRLTQLKEAESEIMIDASKLERVDTAGLQLLVAFKVSCQEKNMPMAMFNVPASLQELIRISGLDTALS